MLVPGGRAPTVVTEAMVRAMRPGSVIVDIAIDQGGCVETSQETTHADPVFERHGVLHYGVSNMPGAVPHTSTHALTNATLPYLAELARLGPAEAARRDPALAAGVNVAGGHMVNAAVADALGGAAVPLDEALPARLRGRDRRRSVPFAGWLSPTRGPAAAVYPGSFDPPTVAHVHVAEPAVDQCGLDRVDLVMSEVTLGKDDGRLTPVDERVEALRELAARPAVARGPDHHRTPARRHRRRLRRGGAREPTSGTRSSTPPGTGRSPTATEALGRLPLVALAPRPPWALPGDDPAADPPVGVEVVVLDTDPAHHDGVGHRGARGPRRVARPAVRGGPIPA